MCWINEYFRTNASTLTMYVLVLELNLQDIHRLGNTDGSTSTGSYAWRRLMNFLLLWFIPHHRKCCHNGVDSRDGLCAQLCTSKFMSRFLGVECCCTIDARPIYDSTITVQNKCNRGTFSRISDGSPTPLIYRHLFIFATPAPT